MAYTKQGFKNGQVLTAEMLNKMEEYFQYCPQGYTERHENVSILEETQAVDTGEGMFIIADTVEGIIEDKTYTVIYNGASYECVARNDEFAFGVAAATLGDSLAEPTGSFPFVISFAPVDMVSELGVGVVVIPLDGAMSVTVGIYGDIEIVHKIEEQYLPPKNVEVIKCEQTWDTSVDIFCDKSASEIKSLHDTLGTNAIFLSVKNDTLANFSCILLDDSGKLNAVFYSVNINSATKKPILFKYTVDENKKLTRELFRLATE